MKLLIFLGLLWMIGVGFYISNPWIALPPLIGLGCWVIVEGS